jgi:hypothetical protein
MSISDLNLFSELLNSTSQTYQRVGKKFKPNKLSRQIEQRYKSKHISNIFLFPMYVDIWKFSFYIPFHSNIYSHDVVNNEIEAKCTVDDQEFTLNINISKAIDKDYLLTFTFYAIFSKKMTKFIIFERVNRHFYYRNLNTNFQVFKLKNWW